MKIKEYPKANSLATGDRFIIDNDDNGTRYIEQEDLPWGEGGSVPATDPVWVSHRNTYRGKPLGNVYTDEQKEAVALGTFDDLYVGDYWTIGGFDWIIADINYWLGTGDESRCLTNHLVMVPRVNLYDAKMNDTNTTSGGYVGSKMYAQNLNAAKTTIYACFGEDNILNHREYLTNGSNNGVASSCKWADSEVELMNQIMVCGSMIFPGSPAASVVSYNYTIDRTQLSLFRLNPNSIIDDQNGIWLRDLVSNAQFSRVVGGLVSAANSSDNRGVRPVFGITG